MHRGATYAITEATNGCPRLDTGLFGWPGALVRECVYAMRDTRLGHPRQAVAYLLDVRPETIALWIENACARLAEPQPRCLATVLHSGQANSGYMFAVSGNIVEDMEQPHEFKNFFFRNGMTTSFVRHLNGSEEELPLERQRTIALQPNGEVLAIPSGMTRFWRTTPGQFAARFPDAGAPVGLRRPADRQLWLGLVQKEMLTALQTGRNRLLEAYLCANAQSLFDVDCAPAD